MNKESYIELDIYVKLSADQIHRTVKGEEGGLCSLKSGESPTCSGVGKSCVP